MKRLNFFVVCLVCVLFLFSCGENKISCPPDTDIDTARLADTVNETEGEKKEKFLTHYIRTNGYNEGVKYPYVVKIGSEEELASYIEENGDRYFLGSTENYDDYRIGFSDLAEKFDSEFFSEKMLVMAVLEEGSGSVTHEMCGVTEDNEIILTRIVPEVGTCDMAQWHIVMEMPRERAENNDFTVSFEEVGVIYCY